MGRRNIGALVCAVGVLVIAVLTMGPAAAGGGSFLRGDRPSYEPGEVVHLSASVNKLDRDWYGPYTVLLVSYGGVVPDADAGIPVGRLVVTRLDDRLVRAEVTFVLPKLPDGEWMVQVRSARPLGDLAGGHLVIGPVAPVGLPPTTVTPTTVVPTTRVSVTTAAPSSAARSSEGLASAPVDEVAVEAATASPTPAVDDSSATGNDSVIGWVVVSISVVVLVAAAAAIGRRRGPRRVVTTTGAVPVDDASGALFDVPLTPVADEPVGASAANPTIGVGR